MVPNIEVIIGTYEEFLLGYKLETKGDKPVLTQSFADKSHSGAIKCLAVHSNWIATGSTDDRIFVYDMRTRKQTEIILAHEGTVNALTFAPDNTYLFSGGDDGNMIATQVGNWKTTASWKKAHGGSALTHISVHPSGKLALSLGTDLILRTWNLVKGRVAYKSNLKSRTNMGRVADCLAWSPTGDYFILTGQRVAEIWSIQKADVIRSQKTASKPICVYWVSEDACLVGLEDGKVLWLTLKEDEEETLIEAHTTRVKSMVVLNETLVTAASAGEIKVWKIDVSKKTLKEISVTNIGCRPTCLGILDLSQFSTNYVLNTDVKDNNITVNKVTKTAKPPQGVVTIEYENDDSDKESSNDEAADLTESSDEAEEVPSEDEESEDEEEVEVTPSSNKNNNSKNAKKRKLQESLNNSKNVKQAKSGKSFKNDKNVTPPKGKNFKRKNK